MKKKITRLAMILATALVLMLTISAAVYAEDGDAWDGSISEPTKLIKVNGIYYYEISTPEELAFIAQTGGDWLTYNYRLEKDIVLNDETLSYGENGELTIDGAQLVQWTPIRWFNGIFDGNGHTVSGLYIDRNYEAGMFVNVKTGGCIKNLKVKNAYIKGGDYVGGIASFAQGMISNCSFDGAVYIHTIDEEGPGNAAVGGIVACGEDHASLTVKKCTNYGDVFGIRNADAGGIAGYGPTSFSGPEYTIDIRDCKNYGNIRTGGTAGGIAGEGCYIDNAVNYGDVKGGDYTGGIVGMTVYMTIKNATNYGSVFGGSNVGGVIGRTGDSYTNYVQYNLKNAGDVTGAEYVGGVVGYVKENDRLAFENISNSGDVSGDSYVGGLIGYVSYLEIKHGYNIGNVTGGSKTGALMGYTDEAWGRGKTVKSYYLKNSTVNSGITAFGNGNMEDTDGVIARKYKSSFCVGSDNIVSTSGHTYGTYKATEKAGFGTTGTKVATCTTDGCSSKKTATIPALKTPVLSKTAYTFDDTIKKPTVTVRNTDGTTVAKTVSYAAGRKAAGKYAVKVTVDTASYKDTKTVYFKINPAKITKATLSAGSYTYNGKVKRPAVTVKAGSLIPASEISEDTTRIDLTYASGRKLVGTYKVTVKGKGNYTGTITKSFKINPPKTYITSLTAGNNKFTVKWNKKTEQVTGYQVRYSTSSKFSSYATKTVSSNKTISKTYRGLKDNKTYYVKVRTYKKVDGTPYYSGWSAVKKIRTK